ncbi:MAG: HAMP domain-containing histidine kinase [Hyphomicrobiales bacterium]|nr:HAMP domain-containing histidine kinase [Hyphomicrobiales bacterium]
MQQLPAADRELWRGLSTKLLLLTVLFVMIAEITVFVPSIANFRNVWLQSHLDTAEAASIVYLDATDAMLSRSAQRKLLQSTDSVAVVLREGGVSRLMATSDDIGSEVLTHINLTLSNPLQSVKGAIETLLFGGDNLIRVYGKMRDRQGEIELVQHDRFLRRALLTYFRNVMLLSLAISLITAALVFLALYLIIVRPIKRISRNMIEFSRQPENSALVFEPSGRSDEIGVAEERLATFQKELQITLRQKQHLADLGLAVSKINHDLRNILASAQLFSDRLSSLSDPTVQRFAPKLIRTIDRAVEYTKSVISYGKALEKPPERRLHRLHLIVDDVVELLGIDKNSRIEWVNNISDDLEINVDSEQLFRVIMNLCRNAIQAMLANNEGSMVARLKLQADRNDNLVTLRISDTGPGIPARIREKLFQPFEGSASPGGTGLGLAIAAELIRAHGGAIEMESTSSSGTVFVVRVPDPDSR